MRDLHPRVFNYASHGLKTVQYRLLSEENSRGENDSMQSCIDKSSGLPPAEIQKKVTNIFGFVTFLLIFHDYIFLTEGSLERGSWVGVLLMQQRQCSIKKKP